MAIFSPTKFFRMFIIVIFIFIKRSIRISIRFLIYMF
uniref:Uncharacterized protein n=1 Tax=virus sp. ctrcb4 TaxID=2825824 RepID=A0A8S5RPP6_9VIRU|nr:MAG TPA: hypothetical protein [virus sp. ctrcb4]DAR12782.1 MAG TPA: hypothetical protein [Crassvirales sp.]